MPIVEDMTVAGLRQQIFDVAEIKKFDVNFLVRRLGEEGLVVFRVGQTWALDYDVKLELEVEILNPEFGFEQLRHLAEKHGFIVTDYVLDHDWSRHQTHVTLTLLVSKEDSEIYARNRDYPRAGVALRGGYWDVGFHHRRL